MIKDKEKRFCELYLVDFDRKKAAIECGYSEKRASVAACEILAKPEVQDYLRGLRKVLEQKTGITQEWVLKRFKEISDRCMTAEPVMIYDGEAYVESGEYKFDSSGANKATEMIGKHIGFFEKDNQQKSVVYNTEITPAEAKKIASGLENEY